MANIIENPYQVYTDLNGEPLDNGYVYIGLPDQDPRTNPIQVYWDSVGTIPAAQPLRTLNGYLVNAGAPAIAYTIDSKYSLLVTNAGGVTIFSAPSVSAGTGGGGGSTSGAVNVVNYGAVGDGSTNNDAAFDAAIAAARATNAKMLFIPGGRYVLAQTHDITDLAVFGEARQFGETLGTQLICTANLPLLTATARPALIQNISFTGANNAAFTNNVAIQFRGLNRGRILNCDFFYFYDTIRQLDTCFYMEYRDIVFWDQKNTCFNGVGNDAPGFDAHFANIICSTTTGVYGFKFTYAGSVTMDNVTMTPNGTCTAAVLFDTDAPLAGVHQISNCVFELGDYGIWLKGTSAQRIKFVMISNSYIGGNEPTAMAMRIDYANAYMSSSHLTSQGRGICIYGQGEVSMSNCEFQVLDVPLCADNAATSVVYSAMACNYNGGYEFVYLPNLDASKIPRVDVIGGNVGSNVNPISLPSGVQGVRWAKGVPITTTSGVSAVNTRTGAVTIIGSDIASAIGTGNTYLTTAASFRSTGKNTPTSGTGVQLEWDPGTTAGYVVAYDWSAAQYKNMNIDGASVAFKSGTMIVDSTSNILMGYASSQGAYKLQVNGNLLVSGTAYGVTAATSATGNQYATLDYVIAKTGGAGVSSFNTRSGAVVLNSGDVTTAIGYTPANNSSPSLSGLGNISGGWQVTGSILPGSGSGLELRYDTGTSSSFVVSYNRSTSTYLALNLDGSSVNFKSGAALVDNNGYMLCGYATSNGAYRLQVNSQIYATSATIATSDKRVKKNIKALGDATELVLALRPVSYEFKKHKVHNFPAGQQIGFIAQEVAAALEGSGYADAVVTTNEDGAENLMGLAEAKVIPLLVKTIQELEARIQALELAAGG